jgi:hypothetical protein
LIPELKKITGTNLLCVYGKQDHTSSGGDIEKEKLGTVVTLNAGHCVGEHGDLIADEVLKILGLGEDYANE